MASTKGRKPSPRWPKVSQQAAEEAMKDYHQNIRLVAVRLAYHDESSEVQVRHVRNAVESLRTSGIRRRSWYNRPESEITAGFTIMGLAWASPDACNALFGAPVDC